MKPQTNIADEYVSLEDRRPKTEDPLWLIGCLIVTGVAIFWRFWQLELKPLHHDEGVNGHFLLSLFRENVYRYDPANYHGPDLYYIALAFTKMFGLNTWSIRASVAIFGVLIVLLTFFLKNYIGRIGSLVAALFLALSPGMVYISRYFIHEILFVFFSFGIVIGALFFIEKRKAGIAATATMTFLLLICFLPTVLNLATVIGKENATTVWILRLGLFAVEMVLVFLIVRMLLAWNDGAPIYLLLATASAVMLFATKETAFITIGTMLIACGSVWLWRRINQAEFFARNKIWFFVAAQIVLLTAASIYCVRAFRDGGLLGNIWFYENFWRAIKFEPAFIFYSAIFLAAISFLAWMLFADDSRKDSGGGDFSEPAELIWAAFRRRLGTSGDVILILVACFVVFTYVGILFFSSFFTFPEGVPRAFEAYAIWTKTGSKDHTQNGYLAYLRWLWRIESPILILSAMGTLIALFKARHRFAVFTAFWAFGLFAAYTIIPYKTPWLAVSFVLPMCLIAGYGINELFAAKNFALKTAGGILTLIAVGVLGFQTYDLNFERYDDDTMPYVYAHTKRGFLGLVSEIERYAEKSGKGKQVSVEIVSPDYWSLPWYLREYPKAVFHGKLIDANTAEMIVASDAQKQELVRRYAAHYKYAGTFPLRPGVDLYLLVRRDLIDAGAPDIYKIEGIEPRVVQESYRSEPKPPLLDNSNK